MDLESRIPNFNTLKDALRLNEGQKIRIGIEGQTGYYFQSGNKGNMPYCRVLDRKNDELELRTYYFVNGFFRECLTSEIKKGSEVYHQFDSWLAGYENGN